MQHNNTDQSFLLVVFFVNRMWREEDFSQVSEYSSAVVVSFRVVWCRAAEMVSGCSRVAVLTHVTSTFVPLVGSLVHESQVGMEKSITSEEEEDKDQKSQHEDDSGEGQEQMLQKERCVFCKMCNFFDYIIY